MYNGVLAYSRLLLEKLIVTKPLKNFSPFMETVGSFPCPQEPVTGPYSEADDSISHIHVLFL
jgi:hypothetical protein